MSSRPSNERTYGIVRKAFAHVCRMSFFQNRTHAGQELARLLMAKCPKPDSLVLALPRGGVPVAAEVASALGAGLDIVPVVKLGVPGQEELAWGAIAGNGSFVTDRDLLERAHIDERTRRQIVDRAKGELTRRERLYRENRPAVNVRGRHVILVDDGLATGASMLAASRSLWPAGVKSISVAVPVSSRMTCSEFRREVNDILCAATPERFGAVSRWYFDFAPVSDAEVRKYLEEATHRMPAMALFKQPDLKFTAA